MTSFFELGASSLAATVPSELGELTAMQGHFALDIDSTVALTVPSELGRLRAITAGFALVWPGLDFWGSAFEGRMPSEIGQLRAITGDLSFIENQLSGSIATELGGVRRRS